jgi:hypothetical protein
MNLSLRRFSFGYASDSPYIHRLKENNRMATPKKKSPTTVKQEMQAAVQTAQEIAEERREADASPAQRIEQR